MDLRGKSIVITGGGTGIGAATARACAGAGMHVFIAGRRSEPLAQTAERVTSSGGRCCFLQIDVTEEDHAVRLLDAASAAYGSPWAVFANAGRGLDCPAHRTTMEQYRDIFDVNFLATANLLGEATRRMLDAGIGGHLLACSSCVAKFSVPYHGAYSATKAAQDMLCQAMRLELKGAGVHVSSVHPVTTSTEFFDVSARVSDRSHVPTGLEQTPKLFRQHPDRVAKAVVRCLRRPRPEVWTSTLVRLAVALRSMFPRIMDRQLRGMVDVDRH